MQPHDHFIVHLENTRALDVAFELTARHCREAIARQDVPAVSALTKTCVLLFGARMENRLFRLLYEPTGFDGGQRARVLKASSIEDRWKLVIREAFAARRGIRPSQVPARLGFTDKARYDELIKIVREQLGPLITLRNTLAHGHWHRALNHERTTVDPERMRLLNTTRLWHLKIKANLLEHLVWLLHDLVLTRHAFERDFDKRWNDLQSAYSRLQLDRYRDWESQLQRKYAGRPKR